MRDAALEGELSYSGVNLDEEAASLMEFQQAYQASARILSTAREMFDSLLDVI
jgi:flagellar hook-associated protein 1 FlgK